MGVHLFILLVGVHNFKRLSETVPEIVGGTCLQSLAVMHKSLDSVGSLRSRKLVAVGLSAFDNGHCKALFAELCVNVQHFLCLDDSLLGGSVNSVTLLPQKLPRTKERTGGFLPAHYRYPLIIELRQIAVGMHDIGIVFAEKRLGGRAHAEPVLQLLAAAVSYPCNLGCKALNVVFFFLEKTFGNEHRHTHIFMSSSLKHTVQDALHILPYSVAVGTYYHTALDGGVLDKLRLFNDVGVPFCEVLVH